jgi:hypothetical protein
MSDLVVGGGAQACESESGLIKFVSVLKTFEPSPAGSWNFRVATIFTNESNSCFPHLGLLAKDYRQQNMVR